MDQRVVYECPVYKTKSRGPTFVWTFRLKTKADPSKWVLAGVALLLQVWKQMSLEFFILMKMWGGVFGLFFKCFSWPNIVIIFQTHWQFLLDHNWHLNNSFTKMKYGWKKWKHSLMCKISINFKNVIHWYSSLFPLDGYKDSETQLFDKVFVSEAFFFEIIIFVVLSQLSKIKNRQWSIKSGWALFA